MTATATNHAVRITAAQLGALAKWSCNGHRLAEIELGQDQLGSWLHVKRGDEAVAIRFDGTVVPS